MNERRPVPLPCPFCGLWPNIRQSDTGRWAAECSWITKPQGERNGVRHHVDFFAATRAEAIDGWNQREAPCR